MLITLIIVGGIVIISLAGIIGENISKAKKSESSIDARDLDDLKKRIVELERVVTEQDKKIEHLETDISFTNKLLEDKTK
ncbi:MAG: hypothetical protein LWX70_13475 [Sphingobacteriia bacterium]|nr:hypothetical protein [Sphingobacteriia bacterium]